MWATVNCNPDCFAQSSSKTRIALRCKGQHIVNEILFQESIKAGLGRGILYARDHDVRPFRDVILDACLHCYSADPRTEGTRAGYMLELVNLLPDRQFYCD